MAMEQMQMPHPTVGMNGLQPPQQQFVPQMQVQQPQQPQMAGFPQYQPGQVPVNGMVQQPQQQQLSQPHPTLPFGQQMIPQQPQQQGWQQPQQAFVPQFQMPQPQRLQVQGQEVLDGAGVPIELRGRTVQQVMQIYNTLAEREIQRQRQQNGQQPQQQQFQAPGQQQMGQPLQPQTQQPGQQQPRFWQAPEQVVGQQVQQAVQQQLAPVAEYVQQQRIREAQQQAFATIPDLAQLQEHMAPIIAGADPANLGRPEFWEGAADLARGRAIRAAQQRQVQMDRSPQQWQQPQPQMRSVPAYQLPQPSYSFHTEAPTPPMGPMGYMQQPQFTQIEMAAMQGMGMTPEQWMAYKGGVQQQNQQRRMW